MKKETISMRKFTVLAIAVLLATQVSAASIAINQEPKGKLPTGVDKVDLAFETRILDEYLISLQAFQNRVAQLQKRSLTTAQLSEEKSAIAVIAVNLKRRAPEVARNLESVIRKVKAAGLWTRLSAIVEARLKDSAAFSIIARNGGANEWLEHAASVYTASANEFFDQTIADIKSKHQAFSDHPYTRTPASRFILMTVRYDPAEPKVGVSFVCLTHGVRAISKSLEGSSTRLEVDELKQDCGDR